MACASRRGEAARLRGGGRWWRRKAAAFERGAWAAGGEAGLEASGQADEACRWCAAWERAGLARADQEMGAALANRRGMQVACCVGAGRAGASGPAGMCPLERLGKNTDAVRFGKKLSADATAIQKLPENFAGTGNNVKNRGSSLP